ncbi:hypothetical protein CRE_27251 [Caenorhabditis remanei]|uniref:Uncharacterized protein n=1 Tax=Caenorhabditis remanei TaxID=31234 RepID=E3LPA2_CAERE|nr:hypothetical protein CRE_27251 [Caenorhabditis remanei]
MLLQGNLDVPLGPIDYEDTMDFPKHINIQRRINYFSSDFYDLLNYFRNFDSYTWTLNVLMSVITLVLSSFSVFVIGSTGKMNRVYQRTIIEHIIMSTVLSFSFPVTGFTIIANYRILMIDKWLDSAKLPLITAAIIVYGYLGVVVFCMYSFFMNFLASVHVRVNSRILRKWDPEFVLRVLIILYGIAILILLWIFAFKSFYWNSESIMNDVQKTHPQYSHLNLEKTVHMLVWTQGLSYILMVLACICLSFVPFSISIISWNYVLVNNQKSKHSEVVKKTAETDNKNGNSIPQHDIHLLHSIFRNSPLLNCATKSSRISEKVY